MPKFSNISARQLINILSKIGYREIRQRGSHIRLGCAGRKSITVPNYKIIDKSLIKKILRDAELTIEEFGKLRG